MPPFTKLSQKEMQKSEMAYKKVWKEDKQKAKHRRKDIPIWMQSSKE